MCKKVMFFLKNKATIGFFAIDMAGAARLELATPGFGDRCSTN